MYLRLKLCPCFPTIQVNLNNQVYLRKKPLQTQGSQKMYKSQELSTVICSQKQLTEIIFENTLNYNPFNKIFCSKPLKKNPSFLDVRCKHTNADKSAASVYVVHNSLHTIA